MRPRHPDQHLRQPSMSFAQRPRSHTLRLGRFVPKRLHLFCIFESTAGPSFDRIIGFRSIILVRVRDGESEPGFGHGGVDLDGFMKSRDGKVLSFVLLLFDTEIVPRSRILRSKLSIGFLDEDRVERRGIGVELMLAIDSGEGVDVVEVRIVRSKAVVGSEIRRSGFARVNLRDARRRSLEGVPIRLQLLPLHLLSRRRPLRRSRSKLNSRRSADDRSRIKVLLPARRRTGNRLLTHERIAILISNMTAITLKAHLLPLFPLSVFIIPNLFHIRQSLCRVPRQLPLPLHRIALSLTNRSPRPRRRRRRRRILSDIDLPLLPLARPRHHDRRQLFDHFIPLDSDLVIPQLPHQIQERRLSEFRIGFVCYGIDQFTGRSSEVVVVGLLQYGVGGFVKGFGMLRYKMGRDGFLSEEGVFPLGVCAIEVTVSSI